MKRVKTGHPNIVSINGVFYFRKGDTEKTLKTRLWDDAVAMAEFELAKLDSTGVLARKFTVIQLYPKFYSDREKQMNSKLQGRKSIRSGTFDEIKYTFGQVKKMPSGEFKVEQKHLLKFFGKTRLSDIDHIRWAKYCDQASVSDLANHRKSMNQFLKWCKRLGYLKALPDISEIPYHKRRKRRILKPQEIKQIFQYAQGNLLLFLSLALFMGMRRSEIIKLKWSAIDFGEKSLILTDGDTKMDDGRKIPINSNVMRLLAHQQLHQRASRKVSPYVFPNARDSKRHMTVSGLKTAWKTCLTRCEFTDITWHDFRATFEKYSNKSTQYTDTQKEKFVGASMDVQKRIYVSMDADDLRGLEEVVQIDGLNKMLESKLLKSER